MNIELIKEKIENIIQASNIKNITLDAVTFKDNIIYIIFNALNNTPDNFDSLEQEIKNVFSELEIKFIYTSEKKEQPKRNIASVSGVKKIIAIGSGKGGVGKSTMAVNIAAALKNQGYRIALVDADIYGPSIPHMLGIKKVPEVHHETIMPVIAHEMQTMSIGYIVDPEKAAIWRGPMTSKVLHQLIRKVAWDDVDIMIIDLPPGTGDVQLSLMEQYPIDGMIIVTTPQKVAFNDALKAAKMCEKMNINIIGFIENMSFFDLGDKSISVFGNNIVADKCKEYNYPYLGEVELLPEIATSCDEGEIFVEKISKNMKINQIQEAIVKISALAENYNYISDI